MKKECIRDIECILENSRVLVTTNTKTYLHPNSDKYSGIVSNLLVNEM